MLGAPCMLIRADDKVSKEKEIQFCLMQQGRRKKQLKKHIGFDSDKETEQEEVHQPHRI